MTPGHQKYVAIVRHQSTLFFKSQKVTILVQKDNFSPKNDDKAALIVC